MNNIKDDILRDAIKTAIRYSYKLIWAKRIIAALIIVIVGLVIYILA